MAGTCALLLLAGCGRFMEAEGFVYDPGKGWVLAPEAPPPEPPEPRRPQPETEMAPEAPAEPAAEAAAAIEEAPVGPQIYRGSGVLVNETPTPRAPLNVAPSGDVTLNFVDADIREVVRAVFGNVLGANFVIDPEVTGTATVQTSRPIAREAVLPTLEAVLQANGAAIVESQGLYSIVPLQGAAQRARGLEVATGTGPQPAGFSIQVVPLYFIGAEEMARILEGVAPEGRVLHIDRQRNVLILAGTRLELVPMLETVDIFDVDWMEGMSFGMFPLEYVNVETVLKELAPVFGDLGEGPLAGLVQLVPIERMNAVLAISPQGNYLDEVQKWIDRLDRQGPGIDQRLFVYFVQNGKAADLADVLKQVFQPEDAELAAAIEEADLPPGLGATELRRPRRQTRLAAPAAALSGESEVEVEVERERAPTAPDAEPPTTGDGIDIGQSGDVRIIADEKRNALLISATPREHRMIEAALKKLDTTPLQVLLEATIMEVTLRDQLQYGLQWFFQRGNNQFTFSTASSGSVSETFPGFSYFFSVANTRAALNALISLTDVNVVSSPQLMVLNNQTATIQVGDQVPIATQSAVATGDPDAPIVNTIQFRDTGVILQVTPRVNETGYVMLEIEQEVSDVVETTTSGIDSPTIQQRKINSTIAVRSGETIALGGLIKDTRSRTRSGLPGLARIPILGTLFSSTDDDFQRTELLVLVVPRVVRNPAESRRVTEELRDRVRAVRPLGEKIR